MKNLMFVLMFVLMGIVIFGCDSVPQNSVSETIVKYVDNTIEEDEYTFTKVYSVVPAGDEELFNDWVYIGNNSNVAIPLDLAAIEGNNTYDCIAVIRIESVEGVEGDGTEVTEWVQGGIKKPNPLLPYNDFSVYKDVRIYEAILWADSAGQLEMNIDFDWPYEKRQRVKVSFMQYAKTK